MPAWLSPRTGLGVLVSVSALIVCALLLTPKGSDRDHPLELSTSSAASSVPIEATASARHRPATLALPQTVVVALSPDSPFPDLTGATYGSDADGWSVLDVARDPFGPMTFADLGIHIPPLDCGDCEASLGQRVGLFAGAGFWRGGGGGGVGGGDGGGGGDGIGGNASAPGSNIDDQFEVSDLTILELDSGVDPGLSGPPDYRGAVLPTGDGAGPVDPESYGPRPPDVVSVPEPSTVVLTSAGALSFMIRALLARKRRG